MKPRFFAFLFLAVVIGVAATIIFSRPAGAQDYSSMSDEALEAEYGALISRTAGPHPKLRGYRGRVTSPDYYVEQQMQQLDKRMREDDLAQASRIHEYRMRRGIEQQRAEFQAEIEARDRRDQESRAEFARIMQPLYDSHADAQRRLERDRQEYAARQQAQQARHDAFRAEQSQRHEAEYQRSRELMHRQAYPHLYSPPSQPTPVTGPSFPGAYFPPQIPVTPPPRRHRYYED